ncbi:MAG: toprim domain-containing protein [Deltaproteobacteria bacterium]|nr:toprim domain-containing protein [Deltaproteobacteria bacterium]
MDDAAFRQLVDQVRERTDLAALVGESLQLAPAGSVLKGRSPWARDSNPSLVVWPHTRTWRDFSAGGSLGGDCFDWVERRDGVPFMEALRALAERSGVEVPGASDPKLAAELDRISERRRVEAMLTAAAAYYHGVLPSKIRDEWYSKRYGFTDQTVDELLLGWADGHLYQHLTELLGATEDEALATGLFVRLKGGRIEDFFRDRLVFPYWRHGRVVYFIARATEHTGEEPWEQAKYKKLLTHSDRHPYVSVHVANETFYNEDAVRGADELLITEGVTDCLSALQAGVPCISPVTVRFRKQDHKKLVAITAQCSRVIICNDAEDSGAGEAGALETAQALHAAGRDVRIAVIPRPEGKDKIDVNEVVAKEGADALRTILRRAKRLPEFLIERIPADISKADLGEQLKPALELVRGTEPLVREAFADLIRDRFKLKAATVKALLRSTTSPRPSAEPPSDSPDPRKGEVFEDTDHYYVLDRRGDPVVISSFQIEPVRRITTEVGDIIDADVSSDRGRVYRAVRFPRDSWHGKRNLLRVLGSVDLQWTGSDENVQGVLRLVASRQVPSLKGTTNLGYLETKKGPRWVTPDGILGPEGESIEEEIVYVPSGASLHGRTHYKPPKDPAVETAAAAVVLPNLLKMNTPEVVLPVLGWFFAAPLKQRVQQVLGHFPILVVWGTQGSGKSTMVMEVLWPLLGVESSEPFSATETEFALLKLLSATNSVPVFIDEYKPFDMPRHRRNTLHRYMRRLYTGEVEERGRADQTLMSYRLSAPLCLAGETRPIEPALVERILTANPDKNALQKDPAYEQAYRRVKQVSPTLLSASIIRFLLARDTDADLVVARQLTDRMLRDREVPFRVRDNLTVMALGLYCFEEYAAGLGIELPELNLDVAVDKLLEDLLESGGISVKTGLDYFLEELSVMAVAGTLQHGRHYVYDDGRLALHFGACHAAYCEHARRTGFEGEVPDRKAMRRQLQECHRRSGYVLELDARVCFNGRDDRRRAVLIDIDAAKKTLEVDDFPVPDPDVGTGYRGWEHDR